MFTHLPSTEAVRRCEPQFHTSSSVQVESGQRGALPGSPEVLTAPVVHSSALPAQFPQALELKVYLMHVKIII